jgi:hypothetical protein
MALKHVHLSNFGSFGKRILVGAEAFSRGKIRASQDQLAFG